MKDLRLEQEILRLAIERGYLDHKKLDDLEYSLAQQETLDSGNCYSGKIDYLLRNGCITESLLDKLEQEVKTLAGSSASCSDTVFYLRSSPGKLGDFLKDWPKYRLLRLLGTGGMGSVYLAEDRKLGRQVAIKFLLTENEHTQERFLNEARAQALVSHPNICRVYEVGEIEGRRYIVMEYVDGLPLNKVQDQLVLEQKVSVICSCARALQEAHRLGIIHRDIKPGNILLERKEDGSLRPVLVDFGLARQAEAPSGLTETGVILGTPAYMSPEQAKGDKFLDRRADIYSLGATLYELVTGKVPFKGDTLMYILMEVINKDPVPPRILVPQLPFDLEAIILKCMEKNPSARYSSASALADDLERFLNGIPIEAVQKTYRYRLSKFVRKHYKVLGVGFLIASIIAAMSLWLMVSKINARRQLHTVQQLAYEVNDLEQLLQQTYLLPLHNVTAERNTVRNKLKQIETMLSGDVAKETLAAGYYSLARGWYALGEYDKALEYLRLARGAGNRDPELDYYSGLAAVEVYRAEVKKVAEFRSKEDQEQALKQLRQKYLPEIRHSLSNYLLSSSKRHSVEYVEALLALSEEKYGRAVSLLDICIAKHPWFYRARLAKSWAILGQQKAATVASDYNQSLQLYKEAVEELRQAEQIARSDPEIFLVRIEIIDQFILSSRFHKDLGQWILTDAEEAYNKSLVALPGNIDARVSFAGLLLKYATTLHDAGREPNEYLQRSIKLLDEAVSLDPTLAKTYFALGKVYSLLMDIKDGQGKDFEQEFQQAVAAYEKSLGNSENNSTYNDLGYCYIVRYEYELKKGLDTKGSFDKAVHYLKKAGQLNPSSVATFTNLGYIYEREGTRLMRQGISPREMFDQAYESYRRSLELRPNNPVAQSNLGMLLVRRAEYEVSVGADPEPFLKDAEQAFLRSISLADRYTNSFNNLGYLYGMRAKLEYKQGRVPFEYLAKAVEYSSKAAQLSPNSSAVWSNLGQFKTLTAEYSLSEGKVDVRAVNDAEEFLQRALKENPKSHVAWLRLAMLEIVKSAQASVAKQSMRALQQAEQMLENAIKLNEAFADTYLTYVDVCYRRAKRRAAERVDEELRCAEKMLEKAMSVRAGESADCLIAQAKVEYLRSLNGEADALSRARSLLDRVGRQNRWMRRECELLITEMAAR